MTFMLVILFLFFLYLAGSLLLLLLLTMIGATGSDVAGIAFSWPFAMLSSMKEVCWKLFHRKELDEMRMRAGIGPKKKELL